MAKPQSRLPFKIRQTIVKILGYAALILCSFFMLYPLLWMIGASFNDGLMSSFSFWPRNFTSIGWENVFNAPGWGSAEGYSLLRALWNTMQYVIPQVVFMTASTLLVAYVISRFHFKGKKIVFALIIGTMLMPATIFRIPLFSFWTSDLIGPLWEDTGLPFISYLPLWAGSLFAVNSFSIFMYVQFFRSIPRDLDEAATIDGANRFQILWHVLIPVLKPIIITVALLLFVASYNDYQGPLIYVTDTSSYPLSLVFDFFSKQDAITTTAHIFSKSILGVTLPLAIFFIAQKYFVGSDADSAIKG